MERKLDVVRGFPEEIYRERYVNPKSTQICMRCGEPVQEVHSPSKLGFQISALCIECREQILYKCLRHE